VYLWRLHLYLRRLHLYLRRIDGCILRRYTVYLERPPNKNY